MQFIMQNYALIGGALLLVLQALSVVFHLAHKSDLEALDNKVIGLASQIGVKVPSVPVQDQPAQQ